MHQKKIASTVLVVAVVVFSLINGTVRNFYGIEITDEAFYVAEAVSILKGNIPLAYTMSDKPFFPLILVFCIWIYRFFVPDLSGVFLFSRIIFLTFRIFLLCVFYIFLRKEIDRKYLLCALCLLFTIWGHNRPNMSYNTISCWLILLAGVFVFIAQRTNNSKKIYISASFTGVVICCAVLAHSGQILNVLFLGAAWIFMIKKEERWKSFFLYISFGLITLAGVIGVLILLVGWDALIFGATTALFYGNRVTSPGILENLRYTFEATAWIFYLLLLMLLLMICINPLKKKYLILSQITWADMFLVYVLLCMSAIMFRFNEPRMNIMKIGAVGGVIFLVSCIGSIVYNDIRLKQIITSFMLFPIGYIIVCGFFTNKMAYGRLWIADFIFFGFLLEMEQYFKNSGRGRKFLCAAALVSVFCVLVYSEWTYLYREDSLSQLDTKVSDGIYKGIYTSKERAEDTIELEKLLREITTKDDRVLFMDNSPMAYMMTDATPWTISTWDLMAYSYGFNNAEIMYRYFRNRGDIPSKIIYIDFGRDEILSIDSDWYLFNDFVNKNYNFTRFVPVGTLYEVKLYELK